MNEHSSHRTKLVKTRGLLLDAGSNEPLGEVYVYDQEDWARIYKNKALRVQCLQPGCDTSLVAKQMKASRLRFFAAMAGACDHYETAMPVTPGDLEVEPFAEHLHAGGGPEGLEHLWMKGRLYGVARSLGLVAVVEDSYTRADVLLPDQNVALEYQRWDTDFGGRTRQREHAGARQTLWLLPRPGHDRGEALRKKFDDFVYNDGGIYIEALQHGSWEKTEPWEHPEQERGTFLYASGSIVRLYKADERYVARCTKSWKSVLKEILRGERILTQAPVISARTKTVQTRMVWVLKSDLQRVEEARTRARQIREQRAAQKIAEQAQTEAESLQPPASPDLEGPESPTAAEPQPEAVVPLPAAEPATVLESSKEAPSALAAWDAWTPPPRRRTSLWGRIANFFGRGRR